MPKAKTTKPERATRPTVKSRPFTRQRLRNTAAQFSQMPVELGSMIAYYAASTSLPRKAKWVAHSLALVCRAFHAIVKPLLVKTVYISKHNAEFFKYDAQDQFAKTKRLIVDCRYVGIRHYCNFSSLTSVVLSFDCLAFMPASAQSNLRAVTAVYWSGRGHSPLKSVTFFHLMDFRLFRGASILHTAFPSLTHLVMDPNFDLTYYENMHGVTVEDKIPGFIGAVSEAMQAYPKLQKLLVRTPCVSTRSRELLLDSLREFVALKSESRLWFDPVPHMSQTDLRWKDEAGWETISDSGYSLLAS